MFGGAPALDAIVQFRIGADTVIANEQLHGNRGKGGLRGANFLDHGIEFIGDAKQQLIIGPVEFEGARQGQRREVFHTAQRHHKRDSRCLPDKIVFRVGSRQSPAGQNDAEKIEAEEQNCAKGKDSFHAGQFHSQASAVCAPIDSMEFVSADYNVCVTVTCHHRLVGRQRRASRRRRSGVRKRKALRMEGRNRHDSR